MKKMNKIQALFLFALPTNSCIWSTSDLRQTVIFASDRQSCVRPSELSQIFVRPSEVRQICVRPSKLRQISVRPSEVRQIYVRPSEVRQIYARPSEVRQTVRSASDFRQTVFLLYFFGGHSYNIFLLPCSPMRDKLHRFTKPNKAKWSLRVLEYSKYWAKVETFA